MKAIQVHQTGGPEVLELHDVATPEPAPHEVRVKVAAAGLNYIDVYHRMGLYPLALPFILGREAAGIVEAVGSEVESVHDGDRVSFPLNPGGYAEFVCLPAAAVVPVPEAVPLKTAASVMLQGMTAHYLVTSTFNLTPGNTALVHAASGGVGHLLVQMAKMRAARVIATVGTEEKAELARKAGADEVILYREQDFQAETMRLTEGAGVEVVYDSVGVSTFMDGFKCLKPRGYMVLYGQASGPVGPLDPQVLAATGSAFLTRPSLGHYIQNREELLWRAYDIFDWIGSGQLDVRIDREFDLADAAEAHRYIEARQTKGKVLLIP
jgi:NADPH2:quinone reductase